MIIFGYPGIGKTTAAAQNTRYIDLETSCFINDKGERSEDWYIYYSKVAEDLSRQGYVVLAGAHKEIREYMADRCSEKMVVIFPAIKIKNAWIAKLEDRYKRSGDQFDKKAVDRTRQRLETDVTELTRTSKIPVYLIESMDYCLVDIIESLWIHSLWEVE